MYICICQSAVVRQTVALQRCIFPVAPQRCSSFLFLQPHGRPFAKNQPSPSLSTQAPAATYVSPASSDSLASGHLCTQAPASSTSGLWAPAPASSDSLASGHLCTQAPASSTSGLWAPAPASSDSLASGHLHMHYICVHTQLLAQTRVRTRGDLVSMYLSRGPCFSRKGCLPRSCAIDQFVCLPVGGRLANLHFGAQRRFKCFLIRRPILSICMCVCVCVCVRVRVRVRVCAVRMYVCMDVRTYE